eukprot:TRINITY_DN3427_c0_g1_i4.p1 TRINITY_DN3427_c0_g1~~TRINITY_DN3427_c0_g1_i4.p1  ORF type:complete len:335 (+),score=54.90 TRINITY_DN3427_c0_g1_i4:158-1162(+)
MTFRFYRLEPLRLRGDGRVLQICSISFRGPRGGHQGTLTPVRVTAGLTADGGSREGEGAEMVLEEDEESMWRDTGMSPLLLDFGRSTPVASYRWKTAKQDPECDMVKWRISGSADGQQWEVLHEHTQKGESTGRGSTVGMFALEYPETHTRFCKLADRMCMDDEHTEEIYTLQDQDHRAGMFARLYDALVRGDKGAVVQAQVDVYQNQRWVVFIGWGWEQLFPTERRPWSCADGSGLYDFKSTERQGEEHYEVPMVQTPPCWQWVSSWERDHAHADENGWRYAFSWGMEYHDRAHETVLDLVCRLLLEKKKKLTSYPHDSDTTQTILCVAFQLL